MFLAIDRLDHQADTRPIIGKRFLKRFYDGFRIFPLTERMEIVAKKIQELILRQIKTGTTVLTQYSEVYRDGHIDNRLARYVRQQVLDETAWRPDFVNQIKRSLPISRKPCKFPEPVTDSIIISSFFRPQCLDHSAYLVSVDAIQLDRFGAGFDNMLAQC